MVTKKLLRCVAAFILGVVLVVLLQLQQARAHADCIFAPVNCTGSGCTFRGVGNTCTNCRCPLNGNTCLGDGTTCDPDQYFIAGCGACGPLCAG